MRTGVFCYQPAVASRPISSCEHAQTVLASCQILGGHDQNHSTCFSDYNARNLTFDCDMALISPKNFTIFIKCELILQRKVANESFCLV